MTQTNSRIRHVAAFAAAITLAAAPVAVLAQGMVAGLGNSQTLTSKVTVKSVDLKTRHVTVVGPTGDTSTMKVGKAVHNLDRIKPGDKIHATYTLETEFVISSPNTPLPADTQTVVAARAAKGELPAAVVSNHLVVTGAVLGIDKAKHTLKLVDPKGGQVHTIVVSNKDRQQAMSQIKVGDTITAYVTESLLVAVNP
jgi:hypothetical protein